ncbi:hypothetical protein, partial [Salmonella enterica]|uniref:hypothetical protein n=1 Tax=Salmonella enterica TaxID=28901 RepID=UPI001E450E69
NLQESQKRKYFRGYSSIVRASQKRWSSNNNETLPLTAPSGAFIVLVYLFLIFILNMLLIELVNK